MKIRVLIVDDLDDKAREVETLIVDILGEWVEIVRATCLLEMRQSLEDIFFDIVVLDLNIPRYADESPEPGLGGMIFEWFDSLAGTIKRPRYVFGLTAYDEIEEELSQLFKKENCFLLKFSTSASEWRARLAKMLAHAMAVKSDADAEYFGYDLGLVVALSHVELEGVRALPVAWTEKKYKNDDLLYFESTFHRDSRPPLKVIVTAAAKMGMPSSTAVAMQMISSCRPRVLAMCGIAAGARGEFGDILIAEQAWDYGSGKIRIDGHGNRAFDPAPEPIPVDRGLRAKLAEFRTRQIVIKEIHDGWKGRKPAKLGTQIGAFASGASVVEDRDLLEALIAGQRKLVALDMEVYGVFEACQVCSSPKPSVFAVKCICDFANKKKGDSYQEYAAYTSANFVYKFACEYL